MSVTFQIADYLRSRTAEMHSLVSSFAVSRGL